MVMVRTAFPRSWESPRHLRECAKSKRFLKQRKDINFPFYYFDICTNDTKTIMGKSAGVFVKIKAVKSNYT